MTGWNVLSWSQHVFSCCSRQRHGRSKITELNSPLSCDRWLSKPLVCSGVAVYSGCKSDIDGRVVYHYVTHDKRLLFKYSLRLFRFSVDDQCVYARLVFFFFFFSSCVSHTDGMFGWYDSEVWDLGHRWTGTLPQPGTDVLQRSSGRYCGLWHHQHRESCDLRKDSQESRVSRVDGLWLQETIAGQLFTCILSKWYVLKSAFSVFKDTFTRAKNWVKELQRQASPNIVIALAGNKADLASKRAVDHQVRRSSNGPGREALFTTKLQLLGLLFWLVSFTRKHKRMQMTTACSLWKLQPRLQWTSTRSSWR